MFLIYRVPDNPSNASGHWAEDKNSKRGGKKIQTYESQASVVRLYSLKPGQVELTS